MTDYKDFKQQTSCNSVTTQADKSFSSVSKESESEVAQSCPTLCDPMGCIAYHTPPSMGSSGQEYWSGLPFPSPQDLPDPGIKPGSPAL